MDTSWIYTTLGRTLRTLLKLRQENEFHFLVVTVILGFVSIFKKSQASSPVEALNSVCLSSCQRDVIPPVQIRRRPKAFCKVSIGDSDIPSSCELKAVPEFKPLQGNPAFFSVRASRGLFHLRQETQSPSQIPIAEVKLHLRCLWKVGSPLHSKTGNQLSYWDNMGFMELSSSCCTEININIDLGRVSQGISVVSSRKSSHLYCMLWNTG